MIVVPRYIMKAFRGWTAWRARQKLYRAVPELIELDRLQEDVARRHRTGASAIAVQRRRVMTARLAAEVFRA